MGRTRTSAPLAVALLVAGAVLTTGDARIAAASPCGPRWATQEYTASIQRAIDSATDLWGNQLLASRTGPTS